MAAKKKPGLWANIAARRAKGLPRKKPGQKGYPAKGAFKKAKK